jgi:hypothetical protein
VIAHRFGLRTSEGLPFQTSAVWTYYGGLPTLESYHGWLGNAQFPRDHYTEHLCFREGWLWHIPLVSWQGAPTANLDRAISRLVKPGRRIPTRQELIEQYACPATDIVSVGLVLRSDRDGVMKDDPRAAFQHYAHRYPAIAQLLHGAEPFEHYYGSGQTFMSRQNFRGYSRQVAGDGWLLIGDAAFFVDPLISPGLTGGVAGAWQAMLATIKALDANVFAREFFTDYQSFIHRLHEALERDNQLVYMSFNHPEALSLVQRFQEIDSRRHFLQQQATEYSVADTNVWGILAPAYQERQKAAWNIMREEELAVGEDLTIDEQSPHDYDRMVGRLQKLLGPYLEGHEDLTPYVRANPAMNHQGDTEHVSPLPLGEGWVRA